MRRWLPLLVLSLCVVSACGGEAESAPDRPAPALGLPLNPWDTIPPDSLYGATPAENLRVTPVDLDVFGIPPGWDGMRIAAISDLHLGLWSGNEAVAEAGIAAAVASNPDLVVLLGDFVAEQGDLGALSRVLQPLRGKRVFAVLGDRDVRSDSLAEQVSRTLAGAGVRVLRNSAVPLEQGGDTALVAGASAELAGESAADQQWVLSQIGAGGRMGLLLAHSPVVAAQTRGRRYPAAISGNTFCGTIEVPGTTRLSWVNSQALPGAIVEGVERLYRIENMVLFVTCGTGYGFVPIRFGAPPEVALITLRNVALPSSADADTVVVDTLIEQYERSMADTVR